MSTETFETEPDLRAAHIESLTGIVPDERYRVPTRETIDQINGIKQGHAQAGEQLLANRIGWLYSHISKYEEFTERADVDAEDLLQIGCLAMLEAAQVMTVPDDVKELTATLYTFTEHRITRYIKKELAPSELEVPAARIDIDDQRTLSKPCIEAQVMGHAAIARVALEEALSKFSDRHQDIFRAYYGLDDDHPKTMRHIGAQHNLSHQRIGQIVPAVEVKIRENDILGQFRSNLSYAMARDDVINMGLIADPKPVFDLVSLAIYVDRAEPKLSHVLHDMMSQSQLDKLRASR